MPNRCYLSSSEHCGVYPSFSAPDFDVKNQWIVCGAGCLPLVWIPMFSTSDLVTETFTKDGKTFDETAPLVERTTGIERLLSRRDLLNAIFKKNGGLDHHIDTFTDHLKSLKSSYVTVELQEIAWLYNDGEFQELLRNCLAGLESRNTKVGKKLVQLSTVMLGNIVRRRQFITLSDAEKGAYEQEDMWNYFRIMGESYIRDVPWG